MRKNCFCCGENRVRKRIYNDSHVNMFQCFACGVFTNYFRPKPSLNSINRDDWSDSFYKDEKRISSLLKTRRRQGKKILRHLLTRTSKQDLLLDYGCGLGIFLEEAEKLGMNNLLGVEQSSIARNSAKERLKNADISASLESARELVTSRRHIDRFFTVTMLDVLEHLSYADLQYFPKPFEIPLLPDILVIKVPDKDGILFRLSLVLARCGVKSPLHQMLQIGDSSPHTVYFSKKGLTALMKRAGYELDILFRDLDYEVTTFSRRLSLSPALGTAINIFLMPIIAMLSVVLQCQDSSILVFRKANKQESMMAKSK
jgi:hypothetical protein